MNKLLIFILMSIASGVTAQVYENTASKVTLTGKAPKEVITASSQTLQAKLNVETKDVIFRQNLNKFLFSQGNIQKKDAEESYWETHKYPYAEFKGKVVNNVNLKQDGSYNVTAMGTFSLHGVEKQIKVPGVIVVKGGMITINATFKVFLSDYGIEIPRLMSLKVAEEFACDVDIVLEKK